jgi:glycosyltransferase involved in cell wall biosynthesis
MRVLHAVESFGGGVLQSISLICRSVPAIDEFAVLHGTRDETPKDLDRWFDPGVRLMNWHVERELSAAADLRAFRELRRFVRELRPDIIHAHSSKAGALCRLLTLVEKANVVYSPRGYSFLRGDLSPAKQRFYRSLEWLLGQLDHITVACGAAELIQAAAVSRRCVLIPNMIDVAHLGRLDGRRRDGATLAVAMCGRIQPQKNFPLFASIAERMQDEPFVFKWIGGGRVPPACPVPPNLEITGWLDRRAALAELASSDVFAQTSLWEGLPLAMLEAMALRLPVLVMPAVGNSELVIDGVNGFKCGCVEDFVDRLRELHASSDLRARLGERGRHLVDRNHDPALMATRWESLYRSFARYAQYGGI